MHVNNFYRRLAKLGVPTATHLLFVLLGAVALSSCAVTKVQPNPNPVVLPTTPQATPLVSAPVSLPETAPATSERTVEPLVEKKDGPTPHIALIVPLRSKAFGAVADAIRQGFIAAATVDGKQATPYRIYEHNDEPGSLGTQYRKAVQEGAIAVIGGVTRDGTNVMVKESGYIPTLALNAPTETDLPDRFFYISLNLDAEARGIAREAFLSGLHNVAILASNTALAKRIQDSFEKEWVRLGGAVVDNIAFTGDIARSKSVV